MTLKYEKLLTGTNLNDNLATSASDKHKRSWIGDALAYFCGECILCIELFLKLFLESEWIKVEYFIHTQKALYANDRVIFLCPYMELLQSTIFDSLWPWRTKKNIQLLLLLLSIYLPSLMEIGWKTKEISRFIVSGKEIKIKIIRNRTKIERSTDFVGWP